MLRQSLVCCQRRILAISPETWESAKQARAEVASDKSKPDPATPPPVTSPLHFRMSTQEMQLARELKNFREAFFQEPLFAKKSMRARLQHKKLPEQECRRVRKLISQRVVLRRRWRTMLNSVPEAFLGREKALRLLFSQRKWTNLKVRAVQYQRVRARSIAANNLAVWKLARDELAPFVSEKQRARFDNKCRIFPHVMRKSLNRLVKEYPELIIAREEKLPTMVPKAKAAELLTVAKNRVRQQAREARRAARAPRTARGLPQKLKDVERHCDLQRLSALSEKYSERHEHSLNMWRRLRSSAAPEDREANKADR